MGKITDNSNDTKQRILEAAEKLFSENGVKTTSLADIARAVNISKGTLYYYYTSKEDIICDITDIHLNLITNELINCVNNFSKTQPKDELIITAIKRIISAETRGKLHLYLLSESLSGNTRLKERMILKYKEWLQVMQQGIQTANIQTSYDPLVLSQIIIALIDGFSILNLMDMKELPICEAAHILANENTQ